MDPLSGPFIASTADAIARNSIEADVALADLATAILAEHVDEQGRVLHHVLRDLCEQVRARTLDRAYQAEQLRNASRNR